MKKLVAEVKQMHTEAGIPLDSYHFGGDEAKNILLKYDNYPSELKQMPFSKSPACVAKAQADPLFNIEKVRRRNIVSSFIFYFLKPFLQLWKDCQLLGWRCRQNPR